MKTLLPALSLVAFTFSSCTGETPQGKPADNQQNGAAAKAADMHDGGTPVKLTPAVLGTTPITVWRTGPIAAGKQAHIDVEAAADTPLPETIRGWVGVESGKGSRKGKFEAPINNKMHGHIDVPDPMPAGSKLWLEAGELKTSVKLDG
ncbi:MAG: hypothetical protein VYE77_07955 [Planctomycetota bacterium]|nr:hypothetical protein [Planctomycetota bacterium]